MSEILLQAIVEKLEALEIALLKQDSAGKDEELKAAVRSIQSAFIKLNSTFNANNEKIAGIAEDIRTLRRMHNQVKHTHHFHKHVWASVSLFIICLLLANGWVNCSNEKKAFEANDIKYRFWKATGNTSLLKIIYQTDSIYNLNKDHFVQVVIAAEQQSGGQERAKTIVDEKRKIPKIEGAK